MNFFKWLGMMFLTGCAATSFLSFLGMMTMTIRTAWRAAST